MRVGVCVIALSIWARSEREKKGSSWCWKRASGRRSIGTPEEEWGGGAEEEGGKEGEGEEEEGGGEGGEEEGGEEREEGACPPESGFLG
jgi:hypothetical protein